MHRILSAKDGKPDFLAIFHNCLLTHICELIESDNSKTPSTRTLISLTAQDMSPYNSTRLVEFLYQTINDEATADYGVSVYKMLTTNKFFFSNSAVKDLNFDFMRYYNSQNQVAQSSTLKQFAKEVKDSLEKDLSKLRVVSALSGEKLPVETNLTFTDETMEDVSTDWDRNSNDDGYTTFQKQDKLRSWFYMNGKDIEVKVDESPLGVNNKHENGDRKQQSVTTRPSVLTARNLAKLQQQFERV